MESFHQQNKHDKRHGDRKMMKKIKNYIQAYIKYNRTKKELYALSNKDLVDIGIYPCDIESVAQEIFEKELSQNNKSSQMQIAWSR